MSGNNIVQGNETVGRIYYLVNGNAVLVCITELIGLADTYNLDEKNCDLVYKKIAVRHGRQTDNAAMP